jgi:transcriptional regulator with XRE-family HTH domain
MEFHEKLQELRKQRKLTQEELAAALFVSRTAVSKWESGRGYPNIESLKAIAAFYAVTIDDLLSDDELLTIAEEENKQTEKHYRDMIFGLLDLSVALFFFLPLFGREGAGGIEEVSLLHLTDVSPWLRVCYLASVTAMILWGIATLALQNRGSSAWTRHKSGSSLLLNGIGVLLFIISRQPYAAALLFVFLTIKALILLKKR